MKFSTLASLITFSIIATTMSQASIQNTTSAVTSSAHTTYGNMSTTQLQVAVEKHSMTGNLSFALGKELMERWSTSNVSVKISYTDMTTAQLQEVVESHSMTGKLSFAAGQELMKRWSNS